MQRLRSNRPTQTASRMAANVQNTSPVHASMRNKSMATMSSLRNPTASSSSLSISKSPALSRPSLSINQRRAFSSEAATVVDATSTSTTSAIPPRKPAVLNHSLVLMASGPDDRDVLPLVAQTLRRLDASLEESRMTCLGADFTLTALLTAPTTVTPDAIEKSVLEFLPDFTVAARTTSPSPRATSYEPAKVLALDIEGPDQPGIVHRFTEIIYKYNVSVKDVITDTSSAPFLGYNIFAMKAIVSIPLKTDMKQLEDELQAFEAKFGLNLSVSDPADQQQQMMEQQQQQQQ